MDFISRASLMNVFYFIGFRACQKILGTKGSTVPVPVPVPLPEDKEGVYVRPICAYKGYKVQATVRRQMLYLFQQKLDEGFCYILSFFTVAPTPNEQVLVVAYETAEYQGSNLFMGNIGDSRAIMGSKDSNDSMVAIQLTVDLKPDLPREAESIKKCKGRVFALEDEPEVPKVWLPYDDAPGLAMARAFGDFCLKEYGVISIPEFTHRLLTDKDQFIVLASDGIWDVLSNEEVVEIVSSAPNRSSAARVIVESAAREWKHKYPTSKMDDCAVLCLFLDGKINSEESDCDEQCYSSATIQNNNDLSNPVELDEGQKSEPSLRRNYTVRSSEEIEKCVGGESVDVEDGTSTAEDQNWLALEGVTRVNSLVQLPRFSEEKPNS
ncbi:probable protein phosphatase 2C 52 [Trifolium pratense]|uniref:probable protein phosphatase 2C 52 n=1 Tax=Trifolium pratense TaxID=57577 RepID=UPI001E693A8E|nr:probable protein phosphatase 2C 52 [Trifolium pratense]